MRTRDSHSVIIYDTHCIGWLSPLATHHSFCITYSIPASLCFSCRLLSYSQVTTESDFSARSVGVCDDAQWAFFNYDPTIHSDVYSFQLLWFRVSEYTPYTLRDTLNRCAIAVKKLMEKEKRHREIGMNIAIFIAKCAETMPTVRYVVAANEKIKWIRSVSSMSLQKFPFALWNTSVVFTMHQSY